jgi:hypothetical protein
MLVDQRVCIYVQLGEVAAGSCVEEIAFSASDEGGRPVAAGATGKVMCGWMRKARTAHFAEEGTMVLLPKLSVTSEVRLLACSCETPVQHLFGLRVLASRTHLHLSHACMLSMRCGTCQICEPA